MTASETSHDATRHGEQTLQGWSADLADDATRLDVLEKAFDFRGDVTLTLRAGAPGAGGEPVRLTGYIFDRRRGATLAESYVRLMTAASDERVRVGFADVAKVEFGKDAAAGKSFETWLKKYVEKKLKGEKASLESETL